MKRGTYILTEEHKAKISEAMKGKQNSLGCCHSEEIRRKISQALKGRIVWNKGITLTPEQRLRYSGSRKGQRAWNKGIPHTDATKKKIGDIHRGKTISNTQREKISISLKGTRLGANNPAWLGGKSFLDYPMEFNNELKATIRKRDNYICQLCSCRENGRKHCIHHIDYNKKNCEEGNLITLCLYCNRKVNDNRDYWTACFTQKLQEVYQIGYWE